MKQKKCLLKKRKLLIERWNFKYEDNNESIEEMYQFKKLKVFYKIHKLEIKNNATKKGEGYVFK